MNKLFQPFHLVTLSPWPLLCSFNLMMIIVSIINWFYNYSFNLFFITLLLMIITTIQWWRDVIRESFNQGFHTKKVLNGIKLGMILFIISELFFFISFFWTYFHMFLSPNVDIGNIWPPKSIVMFNPLMIPLLNTIILLSSGVTITLSHFYLITNNLKKSINYLGFTIFLGLIFTIIQVKEYNEANFCMSDSSFGSIFFIGTGFHGLHVIIGSIFLLVNLYRMMILNYSKIIHFGFEAGSWYWHFVDVIWLFLYLLIYYWSN